MKEKLELSAKLYNGHAEVVFVNGIAYAFCDSYADAVELAKGYRELPSCPDVEVRMMKVKIAEG